nr:MAG TPA: hypothetical protein [Caudoviricetes sp.]
MLAHRTAIHPISRTTKRKAVATLYRLSWIFATIF